MILGYKKSLIATILLGIIISLFGYYLRLQQFSHFPPVGDTADEIKAIFNGVNLIQDGMPRSWSNFAEYGDQKFEFIRNTDYRIVEPWFDEPPVFALMTGAYSISKGMTTLGNIDPGVVRYLMLKVGALNIFLLFILVYLLRNRLEAALAALIFATEPTMILSSRLPISENIIIVFMLSSLIALYFYLQKRNKVFFVYLCLISAICFMTKQTSIFLPATFILLLIAHKQFKPAAIIGAFAFIGIVAWFAYGYYYNWDLFLKLLPSYSGRELVSPTPIISLFDNFRIGEKPMSTDAWIIFGWISVVAYSLLNFQNKQSLSLRDKEKSILSRLALPITIATYLVILAIMSGHAKGWYRFPFHPLLSWASAAFIIEIIRNPRLLTSLFYYSLPVATSYMTGTGEHRWDDVQKKLYQLFFPALMAAPALWEVTGKVPFKRATQIMLIIATILALALNANTILSFQDQFWY